LMGLIEESKRIESCWEGPEGSLAVEKYLHPFSGPTVAELLRTLFGERISLRLRVGGHGMSPFIKHGDLVVLSPLGARIPDIGDAVIFVEPRTQKIVIQRVIKRAMNSYLLKGDSAQEATGIIPGANILGRVTKVERRRRTIHLGLGPERILIALLSRKGLLRRLYLSSHRFVSSLRERGGGH
jgi:hypothetical protein